jgi:hypothetical protein
VACQWWIAVSAEKLRCRVLEWEVVSIVWG